jgi:hypothetical protein
MGYVSSSAFWTASNPSDTTQMTCNSDLSRIIEQTNRRKGSKSSTTRTRTDDILLPSSTGFHPETLLVYPNWYDHCTSSFMV